MKTKTKKRKKKKKKEKKEKKKKKDEEKKNEKKDENENEEKEKNDDDIDDVDSNLDDNFADLRKIIENKYQNFMLKKILEYKRCDSLYFQCLVQYENDDVFTYRLISKEFANVWVSKSTINLVDQQRDSFRKDFEWKYKKIDITRIADVAWRSFDENQLNHLISLNLEYWQSKSLNTYVEIIWKDEIKTFEIRIFIRRLLNNANAENFDLAILHKVKVQEKKYYQT